MRVAPTRVRVALVRQRYNPYGGAERFIERALPAIERAGVDVSLITRSWQDDAAGWHARMSSRLAGKGACAWSLIRLLTSGFGRRPERT